MRVGAQEGTEVMSSSGRKKERRMSRRGDIWMTKMEREREREREVDRERYRNS